MREYGAIFPVLPQNVDDLFCEEKRIFVKFTKFSKLRKGSRIIFYSAKRLVGVGYIEKIEKMDPEKAWKNYSPQIYLKERQYNKYITNSSVSGKNRRMKEIMIFFLKLKRFKKPVESSFVVTPSGKYISKVECQEIVKEGKS